MSKADRSASFAWDRNPWVWAIAFRIASGPLPEGRRERPILFRGELVRAILEGRKTQTRRPVKLPSPDGEVYVDPGGTIFGPGPYVKNYRPEPGGDAAMHPRIRCPYGYPGDRLWVKEMHALVVPAKSGKLEYDGARLVEHEDHATEVWYRADGELGIASLMFDDGPRWRPSIHMPRWASRLSLEIASVRVERLHAITEEDARAEGVEPYVYGHGFATASELAVEPGMRTPTMYRAGFEQKWREIHGAPMP